jgi:RNA polymerase sigma factor (sigma-70 family)
MDQSPRFSDSLRQEVPMTDGERRQRFGAVFASYSSDVVAYCGWPAASVSDAQDAAAEVFLIAWRRLDELPEGDAARVWLYATARRVIANQRRSSRRQAALYERLALQGPSQVQEPSPDEPEEALVHEALRRLGPRDREVLLLSEWEGLTPAEIAVVMGCLAMTARGRLHRARRRFRTAFEDLVARADSERPRHEAAAPPTPPDPTGDPLPLSTRPAGHAPRGGA